MLKKILILVLLMVLLFSVFVVQRFYSFGIESQAGASPGLVDGLLSRCPPTPNCVNSEYSDDREHYITAIKIPAAAAGGIMEELPAIVQLMGGEVINRSENYLASTFTSLLFGFVDDFELRLDTEKGLLHMRSGARVGHGDLGVNSARVTEFKQQVQSALLHLD